MKNLKTVSGYVNEACVFIPRINKKISTAYSLTDIPQDEFEAAEAQVISGVYPFSDRNGELNYCVGSNYLAGLKDAAASYIITVRFSKEKVNGIMRKLIGEIDGGGAVLVSRKDGITLADDKEMLSGLQGFVDGLTLINQKINTTHVTIGKRGYYVSYVFSSYLSSILVVYVPEEAFLSSLSIYKTWLWVSLVLSIVILLLFSLWVKGIFIRLLNRLIGAFKKLEKGEFNTSLAISDQSAFPVQQHPDRIQPHQDVRIRGCLEAFSASGSLLPVYHQDLDRYGSIKQGNRPCEGLCGNPDSPFSKPFPCGIR